MNSGGLGLASFSRGALLLLGYLLAVALLGSVLGWTLAQFLDYPFIKVLSRSMLLVAALGLVPLWRLSGLSARGIGLDRAQLQGRVSQQFAIPFLAGLLVVAPVMLFFSVVGFRVWDTTTVIDGAFLLRMLGFLASACLVGLFEETLFRGVFFSAVRARAPFLYAACLSSIFYAAVHFLTPEQGAETVSIGAGLMLVVEAFAGLFGRSLWDAWLALFLLGVLFCWVREHVSLWACMALHAAWVFALRLYKEVTVRDIVNPYREWVSDYDHFVGELVIVWLVFCFVLIALQRCYRRNLAA